MEDSVNPVTKKRKIHLTDPRRIELGDALSDRLGDLEMFAASLSVEKERHKDLCGEARADISRIRIALSDGYELVDVRCMVIDDPDTCTRSFVAPDGEVVETRALSPEELAALRQGALPGVPAPAPREEVLRPAKRPRRRAERGMAEEKEGE
jgi:hypothetical protein